MFYLVSITEISGYQSLDAYFFSGRTWEICEKNYFKKTLKDNKFKKKLNFIEIAHVRPGKNYADRRRLKVSALFRLYIALTIVGACIG